MPAAMRLLLLLGFAALATPAAASDFSALRTIFLTGYAIVSLGAFGLLVLLTRRWRGGAWRRPLLALALALLFAPMPMPTSHVFWPAGLLLLSGEPVGWPAATSVAVIFAALWGIMTWWRRINDAG